MDRRTFLKGVFGAAVSLAIPIEITVASKKPPYPFFINEATYAMSTDDFSRMLIRPAMEALAKNVDDYVYQQIMNGRLLYDL